MKNLKTKSKVFEVSYTKKTGGVGTILVKAENKESALKTAKYSCFTGSCFRNAVESEKKYSTPPKQGFQGSARA